MVVGPAPIGWSGADAQNPAIVVKSSHDPFQTNQTMSSVRPCIFVPSGLQGSIEKAHAAFATCRCKQFRSGDREAER